MAELLVLFHNLYILETKFVHTEAVAQRLSANICQTTGYQHALLKTWLVSPVTKYEVRASGLSVH